MSGLQHLTSGQRSRLETELAVVQAAIEELDAMASEDVDPIFRILIRLASTQLGLGAGTFAGIVTMHDRLDGQA